MCRLERPVIRWFRWCLEQRMLWWFDWIIFIGSNPNDDRPYSWMLNHLWGRNTSLLNVWIEGWLEGRVYVGLRFVWLPWSYASCTRVEPSADYLKETKADSKAKTRWPAAGLRSYGCCKMVGLWTNQPSQHLLNAYRVQLLLRLCRIPCIRTSEQSCKEWKGGARLIYDA